MRLLLWFSLLRISSELPFIADGRRPFHDAASLAQLVQVAQPGGKPVTQGMPRSKAICMPFKNEAQAYVFSVVLGAPTTFLAFVSAQR
jgi:hypothetical protein